jgi:hypothetical protein
MRIIGIFNRYNSIFLFLFFIHSISAQQSFQLKNEKIEVSIDGRGNLVKLINVQTGRNYASGKPLWRLYFDNKKRKDNEVFAKDNSPVVNQNGNQIVIQYNSLVIKNEIVKIGLILKVSLEENQIRFASELKNNQPHSIVRELQYPLVANVQLPSDHQLLTTFWGGQIYKDPKKQIKAANSGFPPYYPPSQYFLQMDQKYPQGLASNCFAFIGKTEGVYFGSHDNTFEDTGHGLRLYPSKKFVFDELEAGFYKYPNCLFGKTWTCEANVIAPYSGTWHQTSKLYRNWTNTWWKHREEPSWVKEMKGWQRIILKHQYGETFFPYSDISTKIKRVGDGVGINTAFIFGWWKGGMDNDNPNYTADVEQGGESVLKKQIAGFQQNGGKVLWYYNGRLIDKASDYYKNGGGKLVAIRDNTGSEVSDNYKFRGPGTFTGSYDSRTFAVADLRKLTWKKKLFDMADQTIRLGANSVFYDQLGGGDQSSWDLSKEFPIPNLRTIYDKASILNEIHNYIDTKDKNLALGIEILTDYTANQVDYVHARYGATEVLNPDWELNGEKPRTTNFVDWFRYTFPEIILSDRDIRDDTDIERRVNHTVLKGLRNDVEIYRCRALIDETPHYQDYLTQINQLKDKFKDLLLMGTYLDTEGINHTNGDIEARRFQNGNKMAIVLTQSHLASARTVLNIPQGYDFVEFGKVGLVDVATNNNVVEVNIKKHGLVTIVFKKMK